MAEIGRVHCTYFVGPGEGFRLDLEFIAYAEFYTGLVLLNGARIRRARRKRLRDALRWAMDAAADVLTTFGVTPPQQLGFDRLLDDVESGFVA